MRFLLALLAFISCVIAKTVDCVIEDVDTVKSLTVQLGNLVSCFHAHQNCARYLDLKPLAHIYYLAIELEDKLHDTIDDVQASCAFSNADSEKVVLALAEVFDPLTKTLGAFKSHECDFELALGSCISHRLVGGTLRSTRCLTLDLFRSVEGKVEGTYVDLLSAASAEVDANFQSVISQY